MKPGCITSMIHPSGHPFDSKHACASDAHCGCGMRAFQDPLYLASHSIASTFSSKWISMRLLPPCGIVDSISMHRIVTSTIPRRLKIIDSDCRVPLIKLSRKLLSRVRTKWC
ncbi:hypothetical protein CY34DRAFT_436252 [Suillus luteus UH-Slu-Lm8-n1]|uniref:Uncharacterized protein n=1 Tax=Suillus luteus UH-Slu-Lm8-n1 TaxID=930992 RepID=A0A0D0BUA7_9AGAM|nr:hypothetical protein CY34DRAFT_436252 [Suillus luteus UH-Slu-Lm8-n1]